MRDQQAQTQSVGVPKIISPLMEALDGRKFQLVTHDDHDEFVIAYSRLHRRLARSMTRALKVADVYEEARRCEIETKPETFTANADDLKDAFLEAAYRVAELNEFYEKDLRAYFPHIQKTEAYKRFSAELKILSRPWDLLCNRSKHNHTYLVVAECSYEDGKWCSGFSMYHRDGEFVAADPRFHKNLDVMSFNAAFRLMFDTVLHIDIIAAALFNSIEEDEAVSALETYIVFLPYEAELNRILEHSRVGMPGEEIPPFKFGSQTLEAGLSGSVSPGKGMASMRFIFDFYGRDIKVRAPYGKGEFGSQITFPEGSSRVPFPMYLRMLISDVLIEPIDAPVYPFTNVSLSLDEA